MAILVDERSRVLVQGLEGREGAHHVERMLAAGTRVVAGVQPGKAGEDIQNVPIFDTVFDAVAQTAADVWLAFVPARFAKTAALEAADAGVRLLVLATQGIPVRDAVELVAELDRYGMDEMRRRGLGQRSGNGRRAGFERPVARNASERVPRVRLVGPGSPGLVTPGRCHVGFMAADMFRAGRVGVVSRSGTLTCEIAARLTRAGIGQSTCIGLGGDPVCGLGFVECLELFEADEQTDAVMLVGEIGGDDEQRAAYAAEQMTKPVVAYVAGFAAPPAKRLGHAGAIVSGGAGTAGAKAEAFAAAGIVVARRPDEIPGLVAAALSARAAGDGALGPA